MGIHCSIYYYLGNRYLRILYYRVETEMLVFFLTLNALNQYYNISYLTYYTHINVLPNGTIVIPNRYYDNSKHTRNQNYIYLPVKA